VHPGEITTGNTGLTRRCFLAARVAVVPVLSSRKPSLRLWAFSDAHVGTDRRRGRNSLAEALVQSESGAFDWDIALDLGDHSGAQGLPDDEEGREIVRQFGALKQHRREDIFSVCGVPPRNVVLFRLKLQVS